MRRQFQLDVSVTARLVLLGRSELPTICSNTEIRRLLRYRLEVIEAALLTLLQLQAGQPIHLEKSEVPRHAGHHRHLS